ncbi:MAG: hypothetical protein H8E15_14945 [Planctomycetes bacterium]|nr:hypothetical protein [Planctomycetota bacterium]
MKSFFIALLLAPLLSACGDPEPAPVENGQAVVGAEGELKPAVGGQSVDAGDDPKPVSEAEKNPHPHPEWATLEIDPESVVSQVEPEEFVRNIREALRHHGTLEDPIPIDTDFLGGWEFDETKIDPFPPHVNAIKGKYIIVKGFMLPDVDFEGITNFHLVRSLWGCCFGAPPRLNELLRVFTPDGEPIRYTFNTLEVIGKVDVVFETEDGLINDLYRLHAESLIEGEFDDPLAPEGANPEKDLQGFLPEMEF